MFRVTCVRHFWVLTRRRGNGCSATVSGARANASRLPKHLQLPLGFAPMCSYFSPLRPPSPGLGACALVGGLGGAPFCFAVLFPLFPPLRLVRCSRYRVVGEGLLWETILAQADDSDIAQVIFGLWRSLWKRATGKLKLFLSPSGAKPPYCNIFRVSSK